MSDTKLDANQVLKGSYDESNKRLRVDAQVSATIGDTILVDADGDALDINPDGSLNTVISGDVNIEIDAADGDNVLVVGTEDGSTTGTRHVLKIGSNLNARVQDEAAGTKLDNILTELNAKTEPSDVQNIRIISSATDSILVPGVATEAKQDAGNTTLTTISSTLTSIDNGIPVALGQTTMANSMPVVISSDQTSLPVSITGEPLKISGTENGTPVGTEFTFVNNVKQQILAAKDRDQAISYADFGTKNQRITQINYTAPSIGVGAGYIAQKIMTYVLDSGKYKRTNITWSII
jgi:hypothetical protein